MGFVKIIKNKSYFSRYQVKYKRRRQFKTDYYARKRLIMQDKNKYKTPKFRFVVRFSNKDIICQIFWSDLTHDDCLASAYSHELQNYGVKLGLTNYAAAYCTGLLLARRVNKKLGLANMYEGNTEDLGEYYEVEAEEGRNPFCCILDVGLKPTTTGSRMFGAVKGLCDGGVDVPHGDRRFPRPKGGDGKDYEPDAEFHRKYIFGGHVAEYMTKLKDDDEEAYKKQFSRYIKEGIEPEDLEGIYEKCHAAIRENPTLARDPLQRGNFKRREKPKVKGFKYPKKKYKCHRVKLTLHQRKKKVIRKLTKMGARYVERVQKRRRIKQRFERPKKLSKKDKQHKRKVRLQLKYQGQMTRALGSKKYKNKRTFVLDKNGAKKFIKGPRPHIKGLIKIGSKENPKPRWKRQPKGDGKGTANSTSHKIAKRRAYKAKRRAAKKAMSDMHKKQKAERLEAAEKEAKAAKKD